MKAPRLTKILLFVVTLSLCSPSWSVDIDQPVAHWKLDEGSGTLAEDSAGNNDGTLISGPVWTSGTIGGALSFDGTDDYIDVNDDASLEFSRNSSFTISCWAKAPANGGGFILSKMRAAQQWGVFGYELSYSPSTAKFCFIVESSRRANVEAYTTNTAVPDQWHHVACVYENKQMRIYLNGRLQSTNTFNYNTGSTVPDKNMAIGARSYESTVTSYFNGVLDDVRIYNQALGTNEVWQLYQRTSPGLIAHWKLNETAGTTAEDSAGSNDGTLINGPVWTEGMINGALAFDGTDDYTEVNSTDDTLLEFSQNDDFAISCWAKSPVSGGGYILSKMRAAPRYDVFGYEISYSPSAATFCFTVESSRRVNVEAYTGNTAVPDQWHHVVCVYEDKQMRIYLNGEPQTTNTFTRNTGPTVPDKAMAIGARSYDSAVNSYFGGSVDDVRVYNRAIDANEVRRLYKEGISPPRLVAHWKLDECSGAIAHDSAGNNDGSVIGGAAWMSGKINGALSLDGIDGQASVPDSNSLDITGDITLSAWIYLNRGGYGYAASSQAIVAKTEGNGATNSPFDFYLDSCANPQPMLVRSDASGHEYVISTQGLSLHQWHHVLVKVEDNVADFYVDGVITGKEGALTRAPTSNSRPLYIARRDEGQDGPIYFDGRIDDVRIYNYALDADEIAELYAYREDFLFKIAAGTDHTLLIQPDECGDVRVWACGGNSDLIGNPGYLDIGGSNIFVPVKNSNDSGYLENIMDIDAGVHHSLACSNAGNVWAWGFNATGRLGNGTPINTACPTPLKVLKGEMSTTSDFLENIVKVSASKNDLWFDFENPPFAAQVGGHSLALDSTGLVWAWGSNYYGQLGSGKYWYTYPNQDGSDSYELTPVGVHFLTNIVDIDAGESHSIALDNNGYVWCWGYNRWGQLGNGKYGATSEYCWANPYDYEWFESEPVQVLGLENIVDVAVNSGFESGASYALDSSGNVWAWGALDYGQLGIGEVDYGCGYRETPQKVHGGEMGTPYLENIIAIAAGYGHVLALDSNGCVWAWGNNEPGQLGNGKDWDDYAVVPWEYEPVQVKKTDGSPLTDIVYIDAGFGHSVAIDRCGNFWSWGYNFYHQLGRENQWDKMPYECGYYDVCDEGESQPYAGMMTTKFTEFPVADNREDAIPAKFKHEYRGDTSVVADGSVWYSFRLWYYWNDPNVVDISLCNKDTNFNTVLRLWDPSDSNEPLVENSHYCANNPCYGNETWSSQISYPVISDHEYLVEVTGSNGEKGNYTLKITRH